MRRNVSVSPLRAGNLARNWCTPVILDLLQKRRTGTLTRSEPSSTTPVCAERQQLKKGRFQFTDRTPFVETPAALSRAKSGVSTSNVAIIADAGPAADPCTVERKRTASNVNQRRRCAMPPPPLAAAASRRFEPALRRTCHRSEVRPCSVSRSRVVFCERCRDALYFRACGAPLLDRALSAECLRMQRVPPPQALRCWKNLFFFGHRSNFF